MQLISSAYQVNGNSFNQNAGQVINGIRDNVSGSINANINVFSGFARINSIRQYSSQLEAQSYFVNRTAQDMINTVSSQYLQVMLDVELMKIAKENFDVQVKQLGQVKELVGLGSRSQVDEYNQDALTKGAELKFVQAEIRLNNDKAILSQSLLLDPFEEFDVEKPAWDVNGIGREAAELAFGFETERYNLGVTNFIDFTNANRVLVQAQTDKAQSEYTLIFQKILIEYAAGRMTSGTANNGVLGGLK